MANKSIEMTDQKSIQIITRKFVKITDKRQTVIFEVDENPKTMTRNIVKCICTVQEQQTPKETQKVTDLILKALKNV